MDLNNIEKGQIVSVVLTIGYAPEESEQYVDIEFDTVVVCDIDTKKNLIQISNSPKVFVAPQYIQGILISELVLERLGWGKIEAANLDIPKSSLSSIKTGYQRGKDQVFQDYDGRFYFIRSRTSPVVPVKYVHELQKLGINDLQAGALLKE